MFTPPRFVVIDDKPLHAYAIAACIQELGSSCATVIYSLEKDVPPHVFAGARVIFMDLQLLDSAAGDFKRHFAEIQRILGQVISPNGGPYMLVLWTDAPEHADGLRDYLEEHLFPNSPHTRPLSLLALSKTDYIDLQTGEPTHPAELGMKIQADIKSIPSMAALLQWEADVLTATNGVLQIVLSAAVDDEGVLDLGSVLKRIAIEAVGEPHAQNEPAAAVHSALLPLLQDQLQYFNDETPGSENWKTAFEGAPDTLPKLSRKHAATLNSHLHVQLASGDIVPTAWGAISEIEADFPWGNFGLTGVQNFVDEVVVRGVNTKWDQVSTDMTMGKGTARQLQVGQIRVGAACDFAQKTDGPVPYVLTAFVPSRTDSPKKNPELLARSTAWLSPLLDIGNWGQGFLFVEPRFALTRGETQTSDFVVLARMREQLLLELIAAIAHHGARPGITRFEGEDEARP